MSDYQPQDHIASGQYVVGGWIVATVIMTAVFAIV